MAEQRDAAFQVSFKVGDKPLINVRAGTADELSSSLNSIADLAGQIASVNGAIQSGGGVSSTSAIAAVAQQLGGTVIQDDGPPPEWAVVPQQQAPSVNVAQFPQQGGYQQPAAQPAYQQGPPPAQCAHGPMTFKTGVSKKDGKPWKAWFCAAPQGDPTQCKAQFIR